MTNPQSYEDRELGALLQSHIDDLSDGELSRQPQGGQLDLYVAETTSFTQPLMDAVEQARTRGVDVNLFRADPNAANGFTPDTFS